MKITDEMVEAAAATLFHAEHYTPDVLRNALRAALAAQPDRYREGVEAVAKFVEDGADGWASGDWRYTLANVIRAMEVPGDE